MRGLPVSALVQLCPTFRFVWCWLGLVWQCVHAPFAKSLRFPKTLLALGLFWLGLVWFGFGAWLVELICFPIILLGLRLV